MLEFEHPDKWMEIEFDQQPGTPRLVTNASGPDKGSFIAAVGPGGAVGHGVVYRAAVAAEHGQSTFEIARR